ncbi:hypothetical protein [uncultured Legionella sp.]|uniref:hypothetical protein n=1 Tax=uncultured Legionella sp. TaxID=210934 RepID=UPI00262C0E43|nr:hypothetical protein [uncultured Legionella sp.]
MMESTNFVVKVHDLADLVIAPQQNPFSDYEPECIGQAALPRAILRWESTGCYDFSNVMIHLPTNKANETDNNIVSNMFYHYIKNRIEENTDNMFLFRRNLTHALRNAIIFLTFCMGLVTLLNSPGILPNMPIFRSVLTEGLTVIGWVALWRPVELLLNDLGLLRKEQFIYQKLLQTKVHIIPDDTF